MRMPTILLAVLLAAACAQTPEKKREIRMIERVTTGTYWYRLVDENAKPQGYAKLTLTRPGDGGLFAEWELKIAWSGGAYEETRTIAFDDERLMTFADYRVEDKLVGEAKRVGSWLNGTAIVEEQKVDVEQQVTDDVATGMLFVLAPAIPLEEGASIAFDELDEARGFAPLGRTKMVYRGPEVVTLEGKGFPAHKVDVVKENGQLMPVWVSADGRIVKSDWGGGNVMELSEKPTADLYKPKPAAVIQVPSAADRLILIGEFPSFTRDDLFDHMTKPELLTKWWPAEAEVDLEVGGAYILKWPEQGWTMRGTIQEFERGRNLAYTWNWDHMKEAPERIVTIEFLVRAEGGCRIKLTQAPYGEGDAEESEKKGHLEGWKAFLAKLRDLED